MFRHKPALSNIALQPVSIERLNIRVKISD